MKKMVPNTDQRFGNKQNKAAKNVLLKFLAFIAITLCFATPAFAQAVGDYRSVGGNWDNRNSWQRLNGLPNTWATPTTTQGYPGQNSVPGTVTILNGDAITLNVSPANAMGSLVFESGNTASTLTFTGTNTLNVNGAVVFNGVTGNITKTIAVGAGTLSCASVSMPSTNNDNRKSLISISTGTVNVSGDITMAGSGIRNQVSISTTGTLNLGGDFTGGSFSAGTGGTFNCNGSEAQTFGATSPKSFYHFTVNKSGAANTVTSNGGAFTVAGNLTVTQGNLIMAATDADYNVTGNVIVSTNGTLTHSVNWDVAGKLLAVSGTISVDGILTSNVRSHIQMRGASKTIRSGNNPASAFSILTLTAAGTITASGTLTVNDNFWASFGAACNFISGNNTLNLNNGFWINGGTATINGGTTTVQGDQGTLVGRSDGLSGTLTISGGTFTTTDLTIGTTTAANYGIVNQSGGTANIGNLLINNTSTYSRYACTNAPTINISGNWTNEETTSNSFTAASSQVNFIGGNSTLKEDDNFYRVSINKTGDLTLSNNMNISNRLDLTDGLITTGANTVSVLTTGTIINASNNSYINGKLARALSSTQGTSKEFPVGKGGYYGPVTLTLTSTSTSRTLTVEQFETGITGTLPANILAGPRYWTVNTSGATTTYRIKLDDNYNPGGPVKMLKKEGAADPTSHDVTAPDYSNATLFPAFSGTNSFALGYDCRAYVSAGPALTDICQGSNTPALGATVSGTATTGTWSTTSGGTFTPSNSDPNATWTPPAGFTGTASLVFTSTNAACSNVSASKDVIVRAKPTASVTGSASICLSTAYTIPAAAITYSGTTIVWSHNGAGTLSAANTTTPTYTPAAGDAGNNVTLTMSVTNTYNFCTTATGTYTLAVGATAAGQWKGITNNWNDPSNWCGGIPTAVSNVTIPVLSAGFVYPSASVGTVLVNNLTIADGASVSINGYTLQVKGSITSNHGINVNNGTLEMNGASAQTISGNYFTANRIHELLVSNNNGLSVAGGLSDSLVITGRISFGTADADLNTGDNIILRSTAAKTASVAEVAAGNSINGKMTIERFMPNYKAWRFVAAPVKTAGSPTITASWREGGSTASTGYGVQFTGPSGTGLDEITTAYSLKWYNSATNNYVTVNNMNNTIANKEGYMVFVRGDRAVNTAGVGTSTNLRIKGDIQTGNQGYSIGGSKFLSVGNPYPSAISAAALLSATPSLAGAYYAWDPSIMGSYNAGGYQVLSSLDGFEATVSGSALYPAGSQHPDIQSGQAFYLYNPAATGTLNFNITEAMKSSGSSIAVSRENTMEDREFIRVKLYTNDNTIADGNMVAFDDELSNEINGDDALKFSNSGENFGIARLGKKLSVEARSRIVTADTIFYNMSNLRQQTYKLVVAPKNISNPTLTAYMVDKYLNTQTTINLTDSTFISFTVDASAASKAADRFMLVFRKMAGPLPVTIVSVSANRNTDKSIAVRWKVENEISMQKYEVERSSNGADFTSILSTTPTATNGGSASYLQNDGSPLAADNFYRIKAISLNGQVQYSSIVKVAGEKITAAVVSVYPNPVENKQMNISFVNQAKGKYNVELVSMSGQVTYKTTLTVNSSNFVETVYLNKNMASGRYQLRVVAADGTTASQAVFIR